MANQHRTDHGDSRKGMESRTYRSWSAMKNRCLCVTSSNFKNYGGRGIKVCERWKSYEFFLEDMGCRPEGKTLDRLDVNGDYEPGNCRWATSKEQMDNQRRTWKISCFGKTGTVAGEFADNHQRDAAPGVGK